MDTKPSTPSIKWAGVTLLVVVVVIAVSMAIVATRPPKKVSNFEECIDAGGSRLESYPEQCRYDKKTYVNEAQRPIKEESGYVGMSEDEALLTAADHNTPMRVVERDGEGLPVTMDFVYGRHNLHVRDGLVYRVDIEGGGEEGSAVYPHSVE